MTRNEQHFQTFITRVRPHRLAILTNTADPHWQETCLGIIEFFTKLWGGARCIIIPTDGSTIDEAFWAVLSSYDPDIIYRYQRTGHDCRQSVPESFAALLAQQVAQYAQDIGMSEDQVRSGVEKRLLDCPFDEWHISDALSDELLLRLAPFHFEKQPLHGMPKRQLHISAITRSSNPGHPLTPILNVVKDSKRPKNVLQLIRDVDDTIAPPPLWLAAATGKGDESYFSEMNQIGVVPMPVLMSEQSQSDLIRLGVTPRPEAETSYPSGLTFAILSSVMATRSRRFQLPTVVVVGDTLRDFCLYYALYWQHGRAVWLPSWFTQDGQRWPRFMTALREGEAIGRLEHNEQLALVSFSENSDALNRLKETADKHTFRTQITLVDLSPNTVATWLRHPARLYSDGNLNDVTTHPLFKNTLPGAFNSPLPRTLNPARPQDHRWMVDLTFLGNLVPRHPALGQRIVTGGNVGDVRAGREEVSYMCPGTFVMGNSIETNILRPSIHVPDSDEIFKIVLEDADYSMKTSDKGRYEATALHKFGGLDQAGYALWSQKHSAVLRKFLDTSKSKQGVTDEGVFLKDQRRYLNFASIRKIMQDDALSYRTIDEYSEKGILWRGYIFQCENCSDSAWHSIAEVDHTFTCRRCGLKQIYKHQHWKMPNEPAWFYKLDEMVYLMLLNNGHVPLLTLDKLRLASQDNSFLFSHELQIFRTGEQDAFLEIDICCIVDGRLCVGEAKSNGDLKGKLSELETAERYRDLALKTGVTRVVFSTTAESWTQASRTAISNAFAPHPHIEVTRFTRDFLYG